MSGKGLAPGSFQSNVSYYERNKTALNMVAKVTDLEEQNVEEDGIVASLTGFTINDLSINNADKSDESDQIIDGLDQTTGQIAMQNDYFDLEMDDSKSVTIVITKDDLWKKSVQLQQNVAEDAYNIEKQKLKHGKDMMAPLYATIRANLTSSLNLPEGTGIFFAPSTEAAQYLVLMIH